jgi:enoyl reductase-like protein
MKEFTWNEETIDYFADLEELNGWSHVAQRVLDFVTHECDLEDGETTQDLFNDLIVKIEDKVNKEEYEWLEAQLHEKELD